MRGGTRESDERLLDWLALSDARVPIKEIAARYGVNPRSVEIALYSIRKADREAHAPKTPKETPSNECSAPAP